MSQLKSFIKFGATSDFPLENLPFGVFKPNAIAAARVGVAVGDYVLDLAALVSLGYLVDVELSWVASASLNAFMAQGQVCCKRVKEQLRELLRLDNPRLRDATHDHDKVLHKIAEVQLLLPIAIGDYTDFYSSMEHASNVGAMFRGKDNALLPNWKHLPVGYHGRASSVIVSGTNIKRPQGQIVEFGSETPIFSPSKKLDFELEMAFCIGQGNALGEPIAIDRTYEHIFGLMLMNDWSARDIQKWEYVPLGPFLSKSFATTVSPWVVTLDALEPFKVPAVKQQPSVLPYLHTEKLNYSYDINLEVLLRTQDMPEAFSICSTNYKYLYWTLFQQLAHHTVAGCNTQTGDLMASGTISGPEPTSFGSLLELTWNGEKKIKLPNGQERSFIEDGDEIIIKGWCQGDGYRIGFGEASAKIIA